MARHPDPDAWNCDPYDLHGGRDHEDYDALAELEAMLDSRIARRRDPGACPDSVSEVFREARKLHDEAPAGAAHRAATIDRANERARKPVEAGQIRSADEVLRDLRSQR